VALISETSLNEYIREKNGLTYGVSLYSWCNEDNTITTFVCDVSVGTQELMINLFKQSIQDTVSNFDEDKYKNLIDTKQLSNTMKKLSQEYYNLLFNLVIYHNDVFEKYKNILSNDADKYFNSIYAEICSFEEVKNCMNEILNSVMTKNYTLVKNYE
jgi:predicted Zn-dependent peptidase